MSLKDTFVNVLKNAYAARVDFNYVATTGTMLSLRGAHFTQIGNLISDGKLDVQTDATLPAGVAKYTAHSGGESKSNTFYVCSVPPRGRIFEGLIVHEAVHAVFDLYQTTVEWIDNEAIAYIAQGFYLKLVGFDEKNLNPVASRILDFNWLIQFPPTAFWMIFGSKHCANHCRPIRSTMITSEQHSRATVKPI